MDFFATKDREIRGALKHRLFNDYLECPRAKIIEELGVTNGDARIDVALVHDILHGFELKSDADTLDRLPMQMKMYNLVFDKLTLVVGKSHLYDALRIVPDWWGIVLVKYSPDGEMVFCEIRKSSDNPNQDLYSFAALLWKDEALEILGTFGVVKGVRSKTKAFLFTKLVETVSPQNLKFEVIQKLHSRKNWRADVVHS